MHVSFPRMLSRTQRFTLGRPQRLTLVAGGLRLLFLRSSGGEDRVRRLWVLDLATGQERLLADPGEPAGETTMSAAERARRERARDRSAGISGYSADREARLIAYTADQRLHVVDAGTGEARRASWRPGRR
ncbi:hypothetical protein [Paractinoplanes abujensis]|uniref:S9 family peptidase n=1 Tax=Paractinoplanes abujensis TaxID=882441 RepID=A0A7W7FXW3_9ACTN|nr:hypothetical protein [Actinoplanes abujensis]MBB4690353.1 hypothetical protein [Actinoplanes abujensis]